MAVVWWPLAMVLTAVAVAIVGVVVLRSDLKPPIDHRYGMNKRG